MNNKNNKFEIVHNDLKKICGECRLSKKNACKMYDNRCLLYSKTLDEFYYQILFPFSPCRDCIHRWNCLEINNCEPHQRYYNLRLNVLDEIIDNKVINNQNNDDYDAELKSEPYYAELLSTVRQYLEYCRIHKGDNDKPEYIFIWEFQ